MRLFRRSFLCLVVGVTAFGVAGWAFRPRASWTVDLDGDAYWHLANAGSVMTDDAPCWVFEVGTNGRGYDPRALGMISAISADGRMLRQEATPVGDPFVASDGTLVMTFRDSAGPERKRTFTLHPPTPGGEKLTRQADGEWHLCLGGLHAAVLRPTSSDPTLEIMDLKAGKIADSLRLKNYQANRLDATSEIACSPELRLVAVCESARNDRKAPYGVELFELATGAFAGRLLPSHAVGTSGQARYPRFIPGRQELEFQWDGNDKAGSSAIVRYSLERRDYTSVSNEADNEDGFSAPRRIPCAPRLREFGDQTSFELGHADDNGLRVWLASHRNSEALWLSVDDGIRPLSNWLRYPAEARTEGLRYHFVGDLGPGFIWDLSPLAVIPNSDGVVVAAEESPLTRDLPELLMNVIPADSKLRMRRTTLRWLDYRRQEWRSVGQIEDLGEFQARPNSLITLQRSNGQRWLQSWPLPPRDPKWPALGVAVLATTGTWWACARRYRRKVMRAVNATVAA